MSGLFLYGVAMAAMVRASIGVGPWDVLAQGLAKHTDLSFGMVTNLIGLVVLHGWIPLRQRPGIGTVINVISIGTAADLGLWVIPPADDLVLRTALFAGGLLLLGCATGVYIAPRLGPGPRDGLMTGLHARTGVPIWWARTGIELSALAVGFVLGGQVGIGTVVEALMVGPIVQRTLPLFAGLYDRRRPVVCAITGTA